MEEIVQGALNEEERETSSEEQDLASEDESQQTESPKGDENQTEQESDDLPEDEEKRKEAFIRMRQENKELRDRAKALEEQGKPEEYDVLNDIRNSYASQAGAAGSRPFTPDTSIEEVSQRLSNAERLATQAASRSEFLEAQLDKKEAEAKFPELKTDPFFREVVDSAHLKAILKSRATGKPVPTLSDIAGQMKKGFDSRLGKVRSEVADEANKKQTAKQAASLEARGSSVNVPRQSAKVEELRARAREGDRFAAQELVSLTKLPEDF